MHVLPWFQSGQWSTFDWNKKCTFTYCSAEPKRQYMFTCKVSRYCFLSLHDSVHILSCDKCWSSAGPTLNQHRLSVLCLLAHHVISDSRYLVFILHESWGHTVHRRVACAQPTLWKCWHSGEDYGAKLKHNWANVSDLLKMSTFLITFTASGQIIEIHRHPLDQCG